MSSEIKGSIHTQDGFTHYDCFEPGFEREVEGVHNIEMQSYIVKIYKIIAIIHFISM